MIGSRISHYRIISELGRGGMGVVYLAEDTTLNRKVALKFLSPAMLAAIDADARLMNEARSASALDHPNIAAIYDIGESDGHHFIVMAYYEGETLAARLARGPIPVDDALRMLLSISEGLSRAHAAGIMHRDLKPANIMLTADGPKILDFGLAKRGTDNATATKLTASGTTLGTVGYMSPEQGRGDHVDVRTDLWSLGVIAFEMLAGRHPFDRDHPAATLHAIIYEPPLTLDANALPPDLRRIVDKALQKDPGARYQTAPALIAELKQSLARRNVEQVARTQSAFALRRPIVAVSLVLALIVLGTFAFRGYQQVQIERWAREEAIPEVARLVEAERFGAAFALAARAEATVPGDPTLARLRSQIVRTPAFRSDPPGATVSYKEYATTDDNWTTIGVTPLEKAEVPAGFYRWRFEKAGFDTLELARGTGLPPPALPPTISVQLLAPTAATANVVAVPGSNEPQNIFLPGFEHLAPVRLQQTFLIDRYEVTNQQYKAFVDAGGYQRREFWREPFVDNGRTLSWDEAIGRFRDATGRPAPATWIQGEYPTGQGNLPVGGVSWYEAAAYARFAGKQLPTIYHWTRAAEPRTSQFVVPLGNFASASAVSVGSSRALHVSGAYDMAGNIKEWVWTQAGEGKHYILGGGWSDPSYMFNDPDAQSPFDRRASYGFRSVSYTAELPAALLAAVVWPMRDYSKEKPVPDEVFRIYRRLYAYDRSPVRAAPPVIDDSHEFMRRETVRFPAPYGDEQMGVILLLPKNRTPPFKTVLYFPGANLLRTRTFDLLPIRAFDFIVKSGRAVAFPILKGTFDRQSELNDSTSNPSVLYRDHVIAWMKDAQRTFDYLETRSDLSLKDLAYVGNSWGGRMGSILPALDDRLRVQVLIVGGFSMQHPQPEVDQINFASRVTIPTLMLNGRYDFFFPVDGSQKPMFTAFATPPEHKRHLLYDTGHGVPRVEMIKEILGWLDRYQK